MSRAVVDAIQRALPDAALAPSAHNTQPARWHVTAEGRVLLLADPARQLAAGDPTARDHLLSLGAAFEGMSLALARTGWRLTDPEPIKDRPLRFGGGALEGVASASLVRCGATDTLARHVRERQTYRAPFRAAASAEREGLTSLLAPREDVARIAGPTELARIAALYDRSLVEALTPAPVLRELRRWVRLGATSAVAEDGLTAETLGLSSATARAASYLLRPLPFALLRRLGLARGLVSEARAVRSATAVVVLHGRADRWMLDSGRALYRFWLELTGAGFSVCPMSALLDVPWGAASVSRLAGVPSGRVPFAVLRVGPSPSTPPPRSPRLPLTQLLVQSGDAT